VPTYDNAAATGHGNAALGFTHPLYAAVYAVTLSANIHPPSIGLTDETVNLGWIAFGLTVTSPVGTFTYWRHKHWLDFQQMLVAPEPDYHDVAGQSLSLTADRIRWSIGSGSTVAIHVFGVS
jgi:hypothetical protein